MARKAWLKNGKVIMRDGKVVMCEDCPCSSECQCWICRDGKTPAWIKVRIDPASDDPGLLKYDIYGKEVMLYLTESYQNEGTCNYEGLAYGGYQWDDGTSAFMYFWRLGGQFSGTPSLTLAASDGMTGGSGSSHSLTGTPGDVDCTDILGLSFEVNPQTSLYPKLAIVQVGPALDSACGHRCNDCSEHPTWTLDKSPFGTSNLKWKPLPHTGDYTETDITIQLDIDLATCSGYTMSHGTNGDGGFKNLDTGETYTWSYSLVRFGTGWKVTVILTSEGRSKSYEGTITTQCLDSGSSFTVVAVDSWDDGSGGDSILPSSLTFNLSP